MATLRESIFIVKRQDRALDDKTVVSEGLRIGRWPDSDVWLNHPKVSRLHAGISWIDGYFYIVNLSASSGTTLNGRVIPFDEADALTAGDELHIGPFFLCVESIDEVAKKLTISVGIQFALNVGEREEALRSEAQRLKERPSGPIRITGPLVAPLSDERDKSETGRAAEIANALKIFWEKRTREKASRLSALHPQTAPHLGKARFNWVPSRDLTRPWPFAIFIWAGIAIATFSTMAALGHKITFAPGPISNSHTRKQLVLTPAIANKPNGDECASCHAIGISVTNKEKMNSKCDGCHRTEAFVASILPAHRDAGITCTSCHSEHRGEDSTLVHEALESCAKCHNDQNKKRYNGRSVSTPHGGTYGYPVLNGVWIWKGYAAEQLANKQELIRFLKQNRVDATQTQEWRNAQFHGVHVHRVRVIASIDGIDGGGGERVLSCTSCHKAGYMGVNVDRSYPRTTCGRCHNTKVFKETSLDESQKISCTSCHVEHPKDPHWASSLLSSQANEAERGPNQ